MKKNSILPLNVNPGYVPRTFVECLSRSHKALNHLLPVQMGTSAMINMARTVNGYAFLNSEAEWALLIDSDMVWDPDAIIRLSKTAKEKKAKVVSGLTFIESTEGRIVPHAYEIIPNPTGGYVQSPYAVLPTFDEPFQVHAAGGACLLVHRDVYQDVLDLGQGKTGYPWQEDVYQPKIDEQMGEDLVFCQRIRTAGHEIWYEPRAFFGHMRRPTIITTQEYADSAKRSIQAQETLEVDGNLHTTDATRAA